MLFLFKKDLLLIVLIFFLMVNEIGYNECLYIFFFINVCLWLYYCFYFYNIMYLFIFKKKFRGYCFDKVKVCCKFNRNILGFFFSVWLRFRDISKADKTFEFEDFIIFIWKLRSKFVEFILFLWYLLDR